MQKRKPAKSKRKATLVMSDLHFGDAGQLYGSLKECVGRAIRLVREFKPTETEVVLNGDAVAGRGIFRNQGMQNALQFGSEQAWWCAWEIARWQRDMHADWVVIKGNHDSADKENMAQILAMSLRLLGVQARYYARNYLGNFSADDLPKFVFDAEHGFGASSYYANSYELIRSCWRAYIERSKVDSVQVNRFLRGHTHWLNVGQTVGLDTAIDTTGGWHRQEREKLSADMRQTGVIVYLHDGKNLEIKPVQADVKILTRETRDPGLHYETMSEAAKALQAVTKWAVSAGLC